MVKAGVSRPLATRALDLSAPDEKVLRLSKVQPEGKIAIWDYLGLVDEQRVTDGREMIALERRTLARRSERSVSTRHGRCGIWGVESDLRTQYRRAAAAPALATLTC